VREGEKGVGSPLRNNADRWDERGERHHRTLLGKGTTTRGLGKGTSRTQGLAAATQLQDGDSMRVALWNSSGGSH
jgi:hypothetical protein